MHQKLNNPTHKQGDQINNANGNASMVSLERWKNLLVRMGCNISVDDQFKKLVKAYSDNRHAYHNLIHIAHCLAELDHVTQHLDNPDLVEISIWYHDAVYNTRSGTNEEDSANLAAKSLHEMGIAQDSIKTIQDLILSTKHHDESQSEDTRYLIDIDLSILGAAPPIFQAYDENIRKEYKWVPTFLYKKKRHQVLNAFLKKKHIFFTAYFREKYETQARRNINAVLAL